jgi:hypothetical protein
LSGSGFYLAHCLVPCRVAYSDFPRVVFFRSPQASGFVVLISLAMRRSLRGGKYNFFRDCHLQLHFIAAHRLA